MKVDVTVSGFKELAKDLRKFSDEVSTKVLRSSIQRGAARIEAAAKAKAPVRTGFLRESIKARSKKAPQGGIIVDIGLGKAFYGLFLEYGWYPLVSKSKGLSRKERRNSARKEQRKVPGRPFLRPAYDENVGKVMGDIGQGLDDALSKLRD